MHWILYLAFAGPLSIGPDQDPTVELNHLWVSTEAGGEVQLYWQACQQDGLARQGYGLQALGVESSGRRVLGCWTATGAGANHTVWVLWTDRVQVSKIPARAFRAYYTGPKI